MRKKKLFYLVSTSTRVLISMQKIVLLEKNFKFFLVDTSLPKQPNELMYTRSNGPIAQKLTDGQLLFLAL